MDYTDSQMQGWGRAPLGRVQTGLTPASLDPRGNQGPTAETAVMGPLGYEDGTEVEDPDQGPQSLRLVRQPTKGGFPPGTAHPHTQEPVDVMVPTPHPVLPLSPHPQQPWGTPAGGLSGVSAMTLFLPSFPGGPNAWQGLSITVQLEIT